jgi:hypothetical protein
MFAAPNRINEKAHGALMQTFAFAILTVALILLPRELSARQCEERNEAKVMSSGDSSVV